MPVRKVIMTQFRNHPHSQFDFSPQLNIIYGPNGSGKTSVLEAIHCLAVTKSFKTSYDKQLVQHNSDFYQLDGRFDCDGEEDRVQLNYVKNQGKKLFLNSNEQEKLSSIVGRYPVVTLTPEDAEITFGTPSVRRNYVNKIMSQTSNEQMQLLMLLRNILNQRNAIIQEAADSPHGILDNTLISVYDEKLIQVSAEIEKARQHFFQEFNGSFQNVYKNLNKDTQDVEIRFSPSVQFKDEEQFENEFKESLLKRRNQELAFRRTMVGPQSDVIEIYFEGNSLRDFGSQGEHKIILVALKIAEGEYITREREQPPIYLFDDLFAELDINRSKKMLDVIDRKGQILITSTDLSDIRQHGIDLDEEGIKIFNMADSKNKEVLA